MKKQTLLVTSTLCVMLLGGCMSDTSQDNAKHNAISFNYAIENASAIGLIRTFELGGNTTLQFRDIETKNLDFIDSNSKEIEFKIVGQYAVLSGIHSDFIAISNNVAAKITRGRTFTNSDFNSQTVAQPIQTAGAKQAYTSNAMTDEDLKKEIFRMQAEIAELRKTIASANASSHAPAPAPVVVPVQVQPDTVRVTFKNNSTLLEVADSLRAKLIEEAKIANEISVKGYTDSAITNKIGETLAKNRAEAARTFLVNNGVDGDKIQVSYVAAGGFIANNTTKEGRDLNRRVEIAIR